MENCSKSSLRNSSKTYTLGSTSRTIREISNVPDLADVCIEDIDSKAALRLQILRGYEVSYLITSYFSASTLQQAASAEEAAGATTGTPLLQTFAQGFADPLSCYSLTPGRAQCGFPLYTPHMD